MKALIYKRTHIGDPDMQRRFGVEDCMGRVRRFGFDIVIGVGGTSAMPVRQGLAGKVNWIGRSPRSVGETRRGPVLSFAPADYRLYEARGPRLSTLAPQLAKRIYGTRARFVFKSLSPAENREVRRLVKLLLDSRRFDHKEVRLGGPNASCIVRGRICGKRRCTA